MVDKIQKDDPGPDLDRRRISVAAALTLLGGATISIVDCGGGGSTSGPSAPVPPPSTTPPAGTPPPSAADVSGDVTSPEHSAVITAADLAAGGALTLDIRGRAAHTHTVELSADEVKAIGRGERIQKDSSDTLQHYHLVMFEGVQPNSAGTGEVRDPQHVAVVTGAQLAAGGALSLDIRGRADHGHIVELEAADVVAIRAGQQVTKNSNRVFEHIHEVTFN